MISRFTKQLKGAVIAGALLVGSNGFAQLGLNWAEMGPNDIAGRCRSIIVDNTDPSGNKMYAAGVSGGVFKSMNAGSTWMAVNDQSQSLIVSCMAQDATGKVYFGTGETFARGSNGAGGSGFIGTGLYSITSPSTIVQVKDSSVFGNINEVAISSANIIYVAGQKGLFYSTDGGATFTEEAISASGTLSAMDVKVAKNGDIYYSGGTLTAADLLGGAKTSSTSGVYYCPFGSTTFTAITPTVITNRGRIEIAPSPVNANYVYLSIAKQKAVSTSTAFGASGGLSAVLVSNDKGATWVTITLGTTQFDPLTANAKGIGDYANTIVGDPYKADACYLGSDVFYSWTQIASNPLGQGTWSQIGTNAPFPFAIYIHSNVHAVTFNGGNGSMYIATDGGVFKSVSGNSGFLAYNNGLNISQFNSVSFSSYPKVTQTSNTLAPYAGIAGGTIGNSLTYLSGSFINGPQTSTSFGTTDGFQSDFSSVSPKSLFYSGGFGTVFRSADIDISAPSTFYDNTYRNAVGPAVGTPGSSAFANENTPMRLWEGGGLSAIFYNEPIFAVLANDKPIKTTFSSITARPQISSKYDTVFVQASSTKKIITKVATMTVSNTNSTAVTFTVANTRPGALAKYDSIVIKTSSTKSLTPPANQTITIKVAYTGSAVTGYYVTGNASVTPSTNNMVFNYSGLNDSIRFTFNTPPDDSSKFTIRYKYKYYQSITILPVYTGTTITSCNVSGEANTSSVSNNTVFVNSNLTDSIRYTFAAPIDSALINSTIKFRYDVGSVITLTNTDVSGMTYSTSVTLTTALACSVTPRPIIYLPLKKSARLAVGTSASSVTTSGNSPSIFVVKRPLNFGINPDWVRVAGKWSFADSLGGTPYLAPSTASVVTPILGNTVTRLEWAPDGGSIYFSTKTNDTTYYLYRISHLQFIGDSAATDYSGAFSSDIDSTNAATPPTATLLRKGVPQRTTALGKFKYPITGLAVSADNMNLMVTLGGYKNLTGNVYYSNSDARALNQNTIDATNFTAKNGTGLPASPVYTGIFEMNDNKRAIIGTESGLYSTLDITQGSPTWVKETGGNFPNVPVFQVRQQTLAPWECYNSGMIYAGTHGRGIWSTDKYFTPYAIGVEEQESTLTSGTNIKLFPNPANDNTTLWFKAAGDAKYNVTVYDINGKVLIQQTTGKLMEGEQKLSLNTSELTAGIYFVTISGTNNFNANSKLVITH